MNSRIQDSIFPSSYFPETGGYFRVQSATVPCRSHITHIWECLGTQDHCVIGKLVFISEMERKGGGPYTTDMIEAFVAGDVLFYDCSNLWKIIKAHQGTRA